MADDVTAGAAVGAGEKFATDQDPATLVHHPKTKVEWGTADTFNVVDDTIGKRLPVKVGDALPAGSAKIGGVDLDSGATPGSAVPAAAQYVAGTDGTNARGLKTDAAGELQIDVLTVPAPLSTAGGGTEAAALRVTLATDSTGVVSVDDNGASLTIDGTVAVSSLPALVAGTANIGDVDVLTVPAPLSTAGGGTEAAALRVTIATDSTGLVSVDDNGASLTVDSGQLPAALTGGGNLKVSLAESTAIQVVIGTVDSPQLPAALAANGGIKVEGVAGGVAVPVSAASLPLPSGASTEATLATRLSESDFDTKAGALTETAPATDTASSGLNGRLQRIAQRLTSLIALLPAALTGSGNLKSAVVEWTAAVLGSVRLVTGSLVDTAGTALTVKTAFGAPASSGNNEVVAAVASKKIRVLSYQLQATGTVSGKWRTASTDISLLWAFQAREGAAIVAPAAAFLFETVAGEALNLNLSGAVAVAAQVQYVEV